MSLMIPIFKEGPKTRRAIKRFANSIESFLTLHEEEGNSNSTNFNLTSSQSKGNEVWKVELKLEEIMDQKEARKEEKATPDSTGRSAETAQHTA